MPDQAAELPSQAQDDPGQTVRLRRRRLALGIGGVVAAFLAWEVLTSLVLYTDDADIRSDLVAIAPQVRLNPDRSRLPHLNR